MKLKTGRKLLGMLLALALVIGLLPGMRQTAYASETWSGDITISSSRQIDDGVTVTNSITLTINEDVTLTVNGGINAGAHTLTVAGEGTLNVTGAAGSSAGDGITGNLIVKGVVVTVTGGSGGNGDAGGNGGNGGIGIAGNVTVNRGSVTVTGGAGGNGATGGSGGQGGIGISGNIDVKSRIVSTITGGEGGEAGPGETGIKGTNGRAVGGTITGGFIEHSDDQSSWTKVESGETSTFRYVKANYPHSHIFTYSADGVTITATCSAYDCPLTGNKVTLTIVKPTLEIYGETGKNRQADLNGSSEFNDETGKNIGIFNIMYVGRDGTAYPKDKAAPSDAGKYTAEITVEEKTASVDYEIKKADPIASPPTGLTADFGQTLGNITLTNPEGNTPGTWTFADPETTSVGDAGEKTFTANFTPEDTKNFSSVSKDVKVTVSKAGPRTIDDVTVSQVFTTTFINASVSGKMPDDAGTLTYTAGTATKTGNVTVSDFSVDSEGSVFAAISGGAVDDTITLPVTIGSTNYENSTVKVVITLTDKKTQTITAEDVSVTYGETGKSVSAKTDGDGSISYAVKDGSTAYLEVDTTTGALKIKAVPVSGAATVTVTVSETETYKSATCDVIVTINKKDVTISGITASDKSYDGNTTATLDTTKATFAGKLDTDALSVTATGTFADANVGENKTVTITGLTLGGDNAGNYQLAADGQQTSTTASITANPLIIDAKEYTGTYDGQPHSISVTTAETGVTITYAVSVDEDYSPTNPAYTNADIHTVYYKAEKTGSTTVSGSKNVTINQKAVTVSGITAGDKTYDGTTEATLVTTAATITGKLDGDTLTVTGTGTFDNANVGENKTVTISNLTLDGTDKDNYILATDGQQTEDKATITAKEVGLFWSDTELTYTGKAQKPTATATGLVDGDASTVTVTGEQTNVGDDYMATAESLSNSNYKLPENRTTTFKISKAASYVKTAPTARKLTYNGQKQALVTAGEAEDGTMQYALGTGTEATQPYTTSIPAETDVGTYYVWYKVKGDENHNDTTPVCIPVSISGETYAIVSGDNQTWQKQSVSGATFTVERSDDDTKTFSLFLSLMIDGTEEVSSENYEKKSGSLILTLKPDYLNTLSAEKHTLIFNFKDNTASATLTIQDVPAPAPTATPTATPTAAPTEAPTVASTTAPTEAPPAELPQTGDGSGMAIWLILTLLALGSSVFFLRSYGRKGRR